MAYRPTERTEARKAQSREAILRSAIELMREGGYAAAQVKPVAARAGVATGTVYRHFHSKSALFAEVFRRASQREVDAMADAIASSHGLPAEQRIAVAIETWARRALRSRRLAWALLAEPVDPVVEAERLAFRRAYRDVVEAAVRDGVASRELAPQDPAVTAAAIVGAIGEALVGPLSPTSAGEDEDAVIAALVEFCIRSVVPREEARVHA